MTTPEFLRQRISNIAKFTIDQSLIIWEKPNIKFDRIQKSIENCLQRQRNKRGTSFTIQNIEYSLKNFHFSPFSSCLSILTPFRPPFIPRPTDDGTPSPETNSRINKQGLSYTDWTNSVGINLRTGWSWDITQTLLVARIIV